MKEKKVIFHIGLPKTASTSLQKYFDSIKVNHIKYDRYFNKYYFRDNKSYKDLDEITIFSDENYIRSNEFLGYDFFLEKAVKEFKNIKILFVIRNQKRFLESVFKHSIRVGHYFKDFSDFLESSIGVDIIRSCMYFDIFKKTLQYVDVDKLLIIPFEEIKDNQKFLNKILDFINYKGDRVYSLPHENINLKENELFIANSIRKFRLFNEKHLFGIMENKLIKIISRLITLLFPKLFLKKANIFFHYDDEKFYKLTREFTVQNKKLNIYQD
jgi:hypothetical protein